MWTSYNGFLYRVSKASGRYDIKYPSGFKTTVAATDDDQAKAMIDGVIAHFAPPAST